MIYYLCLGGNEMEDFNLIKFDGKPLVKLIDVIRKATGVLYRPRAIRKEADAKAYEIRVIEKAKADASIYSKEIEQDFLDRIEERIIHRELRKQKNIDNVTKIAIEQLKDESNISDTPVDEDRAVRFFNIAEDVSDEQMQQLWGKILAGEVKNPNSFSIRTIEFLKNMTKAEAELFTKAANYVIFAKEGTFIFKGGNYKDLRDYGFIFEERLKLIDLGLIQASENTFLIYESPEDKNLLFISGKYKIKATMKTDVSKCSFPVLGLTKVANELIKLLTIEPVDIYTKDFCSHLQKIGFDVECEML
jgi:hypothetical protein